MARGPLFSAHLAMDAVLYGRIKAPAIVSAAARRDRAGPWLTQQRRTQAPIVTAPSTASRRFSVNVYVPPAGSIARSLLYRVIR